MGHRELQPEIHPPLSVQLTVFKHTQPYQISSRQAEIPFRVFRLPAKQEHPLPCTAYTVRDLFVMMPHHSGRLGNFKHKDGH